MPRSLQWDGHGSRASTIPYSDALSLVIQASHCTIVSTSASSICVLLYPVFPFCKWPFSSVQTLVFSNTLFPQPCCSPSSQCDQIILKYSFSPILPLHTSLKLHMVPCQAFHTLLICFPPPILSLHMFYSDNSFLPHALLPYVPYSMPVSLIHILMLEDEYCSLSLLSPPWVLSSHLQPLQVLL